MLYRWNQNSISYREQTTETNYVIFPATSYMVWWGYTKPSFNGTGYTISEGEWERSSSPRHFAAGAYFLFAPNRDNYTTYFYETYANTTVNVGGSTSNYVYEHSVIMDLTFVDYVYSSNSSQYPVNGQSGDYWY